MSERFERTPFILRLAGYPRYRVLAGGFSHWEYYDQVVDRDAEARSYFAAHAPVTFQDAVHCYGSMPNLNDNSERAAFFAVWAFLRAEYADAMTAEMNRNAKQGDIAHG
ncbi:hypothetical protein [Shinella sp.]|jgi:3-mercaptopyruvate sulfurtransferase SseA|uniref:hypothetical protein n=1 Tax=Shinella sp. TaxID=1870904 RepID=UPI003F6F265E